MNNEKLTDAQLAELSHTGRVLIVSPLDGVTYRGGTYRHGKHAWSERATCVPLPLPPRREKTQGATLSSIEIRAEGSGWVRVETWQAGDADEEKQAPIKKPCCEKCKKGGKTAALPATPAIAKLTAHKTIRRNHVTE